MARAVYQHPAARFCGDSDLLLSVEDAKRVRGQEVPGWKLYDPLRHWGDERRPYTLFHPKSRTSIDVHVSLLAQFGLSKAFCERFSEGVRSAASLEFRLGSHAEAISVKVPAATDLLMVLAANRGWGDGWRHKPHDYLDMALTIKRFGLTRDQLEQRSNELGMRTTWLQFLQHCNPFERHFDLTRTQFDRAMRLRKSFVGVSGGLPPPIRSGLLRARRAAPALCRVARVIPTLLGVLSDLRHFPTPTEASESMRNVASTSSARAWPLWQVEQAARWACRLTKPVVDQSGAGPCVVQSLTLFRLMQKHGHPCQWVLGYRVADGAAPVGHAWVEAQDPLAFGLGSYINNQRFKPVYRSSNIAQI